MNRSLPTRPNLEHLKKEAKTLLKAHQKGYSTVCETLRLLHRFKEATDHEILETDLSLNEVQYALAMDYGFSSWADMKHHVESLAGKSLSGNLRREGNSVWIDGVPELVWGKSGACTFAAALEAALAVTDHP
ncbi:MAG: hypothetical protein KAT58_06095, partial [candidate division Zixibacteria bacterium]|nr:hypothetical protein [candidate division Zixibacteria bacterium]